MSSLTIIKNGAAYLIYLGIQALRKVKPINIISEKNKVSAHGAFLQGALTDLFNPKVALSLLVKYLREQNVRWNSGARFKKPDLSKILSKKFIHMKSQSLISCLYMSKGVVQ